MVTTEHQRRAAGNHRWQRGAGQGAAAAAAAFGHQRPHLAWLRHPCRKERRNTIGGAAAHNAAAGQAAALCCLGGDGRHWGARGHHLQGQQVRK